MAITKKKPTKIIQRFAIIVTWPDVHNAEYEAILRIQRAARNTGIDCLLVNNEGFLLSSLTSSPRRVQRKDVAFAISLHFESPKLFDSYTYAALWNPLEFYADWNYPRSLEKLISHDDFVYSGSERALRQILRVRADLPRLPADAIEFFPSISDPIYPPTIGNGKIFYCGMNWEKINNQKGRHHDLLKLLDETGRLAIYGPKEFMGTEVWGDYRSYVCPVAFDGWSLIHEINKCGICLVLMSDAHYQSGIASSRLYEGLAAGVIIITDDHPFFRERYGDTLLYISPLMEGRKRFEQISDHLLWIERNPKEALKKAQSAQNIFLKNFSMDKLLKNIFATNEARISARKSSVLATSVSEVVDVIIPFVSGTIESLRQLMANIQGQVYGSINYLLILDSQYFEAFKDDIEDVIHESLVGGIRLYDFYGKGEDITGMGPRLIRTGHAISEVLANSEASYFCILTTVDSWFSEHLSILKRTLDDNPQASGAYSGAIMETQVNGNPPTRHLDFLRFNALSRVELSRLQLYPGIFLFSTALVGEEAVSLTLPDLDGLEHLFFAALADYKSELVPSTCATYVHLQHAAHRALVPILSHNLQQAFMEDCGILGKVETSISKGPIPNSEIMLSPQVREIKAFPRGLAMCHPLTLIAFGDRTNCQDYMLKGWSKPEADWCWLDGTHAKVAMRPVLFASEGSYFIRIDFEPLLWGSVSEQIFSVAVNGMKLTSLLLSKQARYIFTIPIPIKLIQLDAPLIVEIDCSVSVRPPSENRFLSIRVFGMLFGVGDVSQATLSETPGFNERGYLDKNSDVAAAVKRHHFESGYHHYLLQGFLENRAS